MPAWRSPTTIGAALAPLLLLGGGCTTIGDDLSDLADSLSSKSPLQAAEMALNLNDPDERRAGIVLLSNAPWGGADVYLAMYRDYAANDPNAMVRAAALRALSRHGGVEDGLLLAGNLAHENETVRWAAASGLQRLHNPGVIPAMAAVLENENEQSGIRAAIAYGLGQYATDRSVQALIRGVDALDLSVNIAAAESLNTLTGAGLGMDGRAWLQWYNSAALEGDPFAKQSEYLYPTFQRDETFMEKLAFWSKKTYEQPAQPVGVAPRTQRRTYEEDAGPPDGTD